MCPSFNIALAENAPWGSRDCDVFRPRSAQAVSLSKATNPPSLSDTIDWRDERSCAVATNGNAKETITPNADAMPLLLVMIDPFDDRQLELIGGLKAREIDFRLVCAFISCS